MNGVHDMGGMHGFGEVDTSAEKTFKEPWQARVYAINRLCIMEGLWNTDQLRFGIEKLPPGLYLTAGYYPRWLAALETLLVEFGVVTKEELLRKAEELSKKAADGENQA
jgi:nitrile hydratase subunit beta